MQAQPTKDAGEQQKPTPRPRRAAPEVRVEQLLNAATELLLSKGLQATTVEDIAGTAGVAKGTMYLYFKSKAQVLAALRVRHLEQMIVACDAAAESATLAITRIERFVETVYDFTVEHARLLFVLFHEAGMGDENEIDMARDALLPHVQRGIDDGELAVADPELVVSFLVYGMHGVFAASLHQAESERDRVLAGMNGIIRALFPAT